MVKNKTSQAEKIIGKIKAALADIRPSLQADGGDIEFIKWEEATGTAVVQLTGHCASCPLAGFTLKQGVEAEVRKQVPEVKEVVNL